MIDEVYYFPLKKSSALRTNVYDFEIDLDSSKNALIVQSLVNLFV
jgi:hypothetical protein